jgi:DNA-binding PadR family transcriptional regulator
MSSPDNPSSYLPLSAAILHILLALAGQERHGYAIMQEIMQQSQGQYKIGPGTLYDNLQKMMYQGLVEESRRAGKDEDPRRRYYRLTRLGKSVLTAEVNRLEEVVRTAKSYLKPALGKRS